jgi:uncharacterized protein (TIGR02996 family)
MSEEQAFLEQLAKTPGDDLTRQVYADWLDEHDDRRGEYLRKEVELAAIPEWGPRSGERAEEARRLREGIKEDWLERAGKRFDVVLYCYRSLSTLVECLRELTGCGGVEARLLAEHLPSCLLAGVALPKAESLRDGLREMLDGIDVQTVPTCFEGAAYETLLGVDRGFMGLLDGASRQKAEAERQRCYDRLASLLGRDVRSSRELSQEPAVPLQGGVPFPEAEALRLAGLPITRIILRRLPACTSEPPVFSLPGAYSRHYDVVLERIEPKQEAFVAWVVVQLTGWSLAQTQKRISALPQRIQHGLGWEEALWAFRRFRGWADIRVVPCV